MKNVIRLIAQLRSRLSQGRLTDAISLKLLPKYCQACPPGSAEAKACGYRMKSARSSRSGETACRHLLTEVLLGRLERFGFAPVTHLVVPVGNRFFQRSQARIRTVFTKLS